MTTTAPKARRRCVRRASCDHRTGHGLPAYPASVSAWSVARCAAAYARTMGGSMKKVDENQDRPVLPLLMKSHPGLQQESGHELTHPTASRLRIIGTSPTGHANQGDLSGQSPLHEGRTVHVPAHEIATTVSAWLAELGAHSPFVDDLARASAPATGPRPRHRRLPIRRRDGRGLISQKDPRFGAPHRPSEPRARARCCRMSSYKLSSVDRVLDFLRIGDLRRGVADGQRQPPTITATAATHSRP